MQRVEVLQYLQNKETQIFLGKLKSDWVRVPYLIFKVGQALFFAKGILCGEGILYIIQAVFAVVVWNSGAKRQPSVKRER